MVFLTGRIYKINPRNYSCIEKNFTEKGEKKYDEELYLVVENVRENEYGFISNVSIDFYKYIRTREKGQQRVVTYENGEIQIYNKEPIEGFIAVFGKTDFQRAVLDSVLKLCGRGALKFIVFDIDRKFDLLKQNFRDFRRIYVKKIDGMCKYQNSSEFFILRTELKGIGYFFNRCAKLLIFFVSPLPRIKTGVIN